MVNGKKLVVSASPHLRNKTTTTKIMLDVIIALIPAFIASIILFGPRVLAVTATTIVTAVLSEYIARKVMKRHNTLSDLSAVVTGLILAFNLPVDIPLWIAAIGSVVAIIVVKQFFGGIGQNFANPAITARIVLLLSFATKMSGSNWVAPLSWRGADAVTTATPLALYGDETATLPSLLDMFIGNRAGSLGETCTVALLIGGIYLIARKVISFKIPVAYLGRCFHWSILYGNRLFHQPHQHRRQISLRCWLRYHNCTHQNFRFTARRCIFRNPYYESSCSSY